MFSSFSGFRKHLNKVHGYCSELLFADCEMPLTKFEGHVSDYMDVGVYSSSDQSLCGHKSVVNNSASVMPQLKAAALGQMAVNSFVTSLEEIPFQRCFHQRPMV